MQLRDIADKNTFRNNHYFSITGLSSSRQPSMADSQHEGSSVSFGLTWEQQKKRQWLLLYPVMTWQPWDVQMLNCLSDKSQANTAESQNTICFVIKYSHYKVVRMSSPKFLNIVLQSQRNILYRNRKHYLIVFVNSMMVTEYYDCLEDMVSFLIFQIRNSFLGIHKLLSL